jgi:hypothetical protein
MDKLNESQKVPPIQTIAFEDIPTPEEHAREVFKIFRTFVTIAAIFVVLAVNAIAIALVKGVPPSVVAVFAMMTMNVCVIAFGVGYGIPVGLVSLRRLEIAYRMGYFGIGQSREATASMKQIAERIKKEATPLPSGRRPSVEA